MFFNTLDEYDKELEDIKSTLESMEKRLDDEPGIVARKGNYNGLKHIYEIISKDSDEFLEMMGESINLHILGNAVKNQKISLSVINEIFSNFDKLSKFTTDLLKSNLNYSFESHDLKVDQLGGGSIHVLFSMDDEITDLREVYLNHQVFEKIFDLISCNEEDLLNQKDIIGLDALLAYKKFLKVFIDNDLDFTLENNSRKVGLTSNEASKIFKKIDDGI